MARSGPDAPAALQRPQQDAQACGAAAHAETEDLLSALLPDAVLELILRRLRGGDRVALASCSLRCLARVLSNARCTWEPAALAGTLLQRLAALHHPASSLGMLGAAEDDVRVRVPLREVGYLADALRRRGGHSPRQHRDACPSLLQLLRSVGGLQSVRELVVDDWKRVPAGLANLDRLEVAQAATPPINVVATGERVAADAPASSVARLRTLVVRSSVHRLPEDMRCVERVEFFSGAVHRSPALLPTPDGSRVLPESSAQAVKRIKLGHWKQLALPDMPQLEEIELRCCALPPDTRQFLAGSERVRSFVAEHCDLVPLPDNLPLEELQFPGCNLPLQFRHALLPPGSARRVRTLLAAQSQVAALPLNDMQALRELDLGWCFSLSTSFFQSLPTAHLPNLVRLRLSGTIVERLPPRMRCLRELLLDDCSALRADFLPACSAAGVRVLSCERSSVVRVPEGMRALTRLTLNRCLALAPDAIPESSARAVKHLAAADSSLVRLPPGMAALERLQAVRCRFLARDAVPESSARALRSVDARASSLARLPPNMAALERLCVDGCAALDEDFLPSSSAAAVRELHASMSNIVRVPPCMAALTFLDISECWCLDGAAVVPESSGGALETVNAYHSNLEMLPRNMTSLTSIDVSECRALHPTLWLPESSRQHLRM
ncbi:unnamed protein product [Pedinophyceae sp. YPF-701]|nr:unnamed protein product [Pedinophyceae sp. YPF-701]